MTTTDRLARPPRFSVCIPNFNYEPFIERTIRSVLDQGDGSLEIVVSDNASTDASEDVVRSIEDARIRLHRNRCNVGFAGNLDRAARLATGQRLIMLSSDDLMRPGAIAIYTTLFDALGGAGDRTVLSSTCDVIDAQDAVVGLKGRDDVVWAGATRAPELEALIDAPVWRAPAGDLLARCLRTMRNPFNFAATAYPRRLYEQVEGYGGGRLMNPDKWFHWKLLSAAESAVFVESPLFAYRWHASNQTAQQTAQGALKFLVDEYVSTVEIGDDVLSRVGVSRAELVRAFVRHDIANHGLATLARGERRRARRIYDFGRATYPWALRRDGSAIGFRVLLGLGPIGQGAAAHAYRRYSGRWRNIAR